VALEALFTKYVFKAVLLHVPVPAHPHGVAGCQQPVPGASAVVKLGCSVAYYIACYNAI